MPSTLDPKNETGGGVAVAETWIPTLKEMFEENFLETARCKRESDLCVIMSLCCICCTLSSFFLTPFFFEKLFVSICFVYECKSDFDLFIYIQHLH